MASDHSAVLTREGLDALIAAPGNAGDRVCGPTARDRAIVYGDISGAEDLPEGDGDETFALFGERAANWRPCNARLSDIERARRSKPRKPIVSKRRWKKDMVGKTSQSPRHINAPPAPTPEVLEICASFGNDRHRMMDILHAVQDRYRWIAPETMEAIAEATGLSRIQVEGVASFYTFFSLTPKGRVTIRLCDDIIDRYRRARGGGRANSRRRWASRSARPRRTVRSRSNTRPASACATRRRRR